MVMILGSFIGVNIGIWGACLSGAGTVDIATAGTLGTAAMTLGLVITRALFPRDW